MPLFNVRHWPAFNDVDSDKPAVAEADTRTLGAARHIDEARSQSVARVEQQQSPLEIDHLSQFPSATFSFDLAPGYSLGTAVDAIQKAQVDAEGRKARPWLWAGAVLALVLMVTRSLRRRG